MSARIIGVCVLAALAFRLAACAAPSQPGTDPQPGAGGDGIVAGKSAYGMTETVARLKQDIAGKGLMFFDQIDQARLAKNAGIALAPSTLLVFGNPALGSQFMTANPRSGIDWPVRLLVFQDRNGQVWTEYTDFNYITARHRISGRDAQFKKASAVIGSITASVAAP